MSAQTPTPRSSPTCRSRHCHAPVARAQTYCAECLAETHEEPPTTGGGQR